MNRLLLLLLLLLAASCSRDATPLSLKTAPALSPEAKPYAKVGWAENKFTWEGQPFTGIAEEAYKKTGRLKMRLHIASGLKHGLVEEWYENGNKKTHTHYQHDKHQGDNFYWNEDDTLQTHKVWKDDVLVSQTDGRK